MTSILEEQFSFPVTYGNQQLTLRGYLFSPEGGAAAGSVPVVFNSGFTGGVSMYGQLMGRALAQRGFSVVTYDVSGFFTNKAVRNTRPGADGLVTNVSLEDQTTELLALIEWTCARFNAMPAVISWAMGSVASLAAVVELARRGGEQIAFYVPMSYTRLTALQSLRRDALGAHFDIMKLADDAEIPPFELGNDATRLGFYPLDPATDNYVDNQLGNYTDAGGVDHWPGCSKVTAASYKSYVMFNPEADLASVKGGFPPALIVHGKLNTLHMPAESVRLNEVYPGEGTLLLVDGLQHGQQLEADNPVYNGLMDKVADALRAVRA